MDVPEALRAQNEWWATGRVPQAFLPKWKRPEFGRMLSLLDDGRITALIGPRRTGKTTLMYQLADHLISKGVDPRSILFFSADDPALARLGESLFEEVLSAYYDEILVGERRSKKTYVLIDEIHMQQGWERWLKRYYDLKYAIKFVISSSSATHVSRRSKESLVGRISEISVLPLNFPDYLSLIGEGAVAEHYRGMTPEKALADRISALKFSEKARLLLNRYLLYGGMPEGASQSDLRLWQEKLLSDVMRKAIYRDLVEAYGVRSPKKLEDLFIFMAYNCGTPLSYSSIAQNLGISIESVINYTSYLSEACLAGELMLYSKSVEKSLRANRKYFLTDPGLQNAITRVSEIASAKAGPIIESAVQKHMHALFMNTGRELFYWRDVEEVDLVLRDGQRITPLEVKYASSIQKSELKGILKFMTKFKVRRGIVVTKDILERRSMDEKELLLIPAWLFLLSA